MASVAQITANRANAQKSTGPRTPAGKARVARNAVQHGLLAQRVVVPGEDPDEFALYRDRMWEDLDPVGAVEGLLADRIVHLAWRLRRAERLERATLTLLETRHVAKAKAKASLTRVAAGATPPGESPAEEDELLLGRVVVEDFGDEKLLERLLGYERRIENSLYRTMSELRKQRLLRDVASSERSEFRLQAGGESGSSAVSTSSEGGTTNGAQGEESSCGTKPIGVGGSENREAGTETLETGRGRPGYEEVPGDGARHSNIPSFQDSSSPAGPSGETKPNEVSSGEFQVSSEESQLTSEPG